MNYEVEQKYVVDDFSSFQQKLATHALRQNPPITQIDTYFAHPQRDFAKTDEALRLRQVGERNFVTYKGPKIDTTTKTRREIELPLGSGPETAAQFGELLSTLDFRRVSQVTKQRRTVLLEWQGQQFELALDQVQRLGTFVELETSATEDTLPAAQAALASLATELGLNAPQRRSYLELLLELESPGE